MKIKDNDDADDRRGIIAPRHSELATCIIQSDLRNGVRSDFVSIGVQILNETVVSPFVRYEKCRAGFTSVRIQSLARVEKQLEDLIVHVIDSILECDENQLRCLVQWQLTFMVPWLKFIF